MTASVRTLIKDLTQWEEATLGLPIFVQVDVDGKPHRLLLGSIKIDGGVVLVGEPEPVPDPVVAPVPGVYSERQHQHVWQRDNLQEQWLCAHPGCVIISFEELLGHPIPETEAQGFALLNHIAELKLTAQPADEL